MKHLLVLIYITSTIKQNTPILCLKLCEFIEYIPMDIISKIFTNLLFYTVQYTNERVQEPKSFVEIIY